MAEKDSNMYFSAYNGFARKQLEKYGWKEGQGLGKINDGITTPVKPKLKNNTNGLGYSFGKELVFDWWTGVYEKALVNMKSNEDKNSVELENNASGSISSRVIDVEGADDKADESKIILAINRGYQYKTTRSKEKDGINNKPPSFNSFMSPANDIKELTKKFSSSVSMFVKANQVEAIDPELPVLKPLTDDELLRACGGRTCHKTARHGLKLSGKLSRIDKQEQMLAKKFQNVSLNEKSNVEKKVKKLVKHMQRCKKMITDREYSLSDEESRSSASSLTKTKQKKKKERKNVSFSEVVSVTEYPIDPKESITTGDPIVCGNSNLFSGNNLFLGNNYLFSGNNNTSPSDVNGNDEGIEQDLETVNYGKISSIGFKPRVRKRKGRTYKVVDLAIQCKSEPSDGSRFVNLVGEGSSVMEDEFTEGISPLKRLKLSDVKYLNNDELKHECSDDQDKKKTEKRKRKREEKRLRELERRRRKGRDEQASIQSITKSLHKLCNLSDEN